MNIISTLKKVNWLVKWTKEKPTLFHPAPSPFGIPYRTMYSKNIKNLMFAGRNISVTHAALSATRVMATCATIGQAVGTAAYIAVREGISPHGVYENHLCELKNTLMRDDCYLPFNTYQFGCLTKNAKLSSDCPGFENIRNGKSRPIDGEDNGWLGNKGSYLEYKFDSPAYITEVRIIFDSDLNRKDRPMVSNKYLDDMPAAVAESMVKAFDVIAVNEGAESVVASINNNYQRLVIVPCGITAESIKLVTKETWGAPKCHVFSFEVI